MNALMSAACESPSTGVDILALIGANGAVYSPQQIGTMWQDIGETVPVTASGQPVGHFDDYAGNLAALQQVAADASRPTYTESGGLEYLAFDGADDGLLGQNVTLINTTFNAFVGFVWKSSNAAGTQVVFADRYSTTYVWQMYIDGGKWIGFLRGAGGGGDISVTSTSNVSTTTPQVVMLRHNTTTHLTELLIDNVVEATSSVDAGTIGITPNELTIGNAAGGNFAAGNFYALAGRRGAWTTNDTDDAYTWLAQQAGLV